ncbi:MAG: hypothetical protein ABI354_01305, partial [Candidatus Saccharimonadales bacterium]
MAIENRLVDDPAHIQQLRLNIRAENAEAISIPADSMGYDSWPDHLSDSVGSLATANSGEFEPNGRIEDPDLDKEWREQVAADRARRNLHAVPATTRRSTARQQNLNELDYIKRVR